MRAGRRWPRTLTDGNARVRRYTRLVLIVCLLPLAAGCTPKPDMGKAVDLHRQMGPRGEPPPVPELEPQGNRILTMPAAGSLQAL